MTVDMKEENLLFDLSTLTAPELLLYMVYCCINCALTWQFIRCTELQPP